MNHGKFLHMTNKAHAASQKLVMAAGHAQTTLLHAVTALISELYVQILKPAKTGRFGLIRDTSQKAHVVCEVNHKTCEASDTNNIGRNQEAIPLGEAGSEYDDA
ncbi:hypothetical protein Tco_0888208 [Tanacetum coccineum]